MGKSGSEGALGSLQLDFAGAMGEDTAGVAGIQAFQGLLSRSIQLDALGYLLITALLALVSVLGFMLFNSIAPPEDWLLGRDTIQLLALFFICAVVFYLLDTHARLRKRLHESLDEAYEARRQTLRAVASLVSAHHAAEIMVAITEDRALERVVESVRADFDADAAAIMMDDAVTAFRDGRVNDDVSTAFSELALRVVRTGAPIGSSQAAGGSALAVPLRVLGRLRGVLCVWQSDSALLPDVEGVGLLGRVIELGWESRILYEGTESQATHLADLLVSLIDERKPGYEESTARLVDMLERISATGALAADGLDDGKLAARLRDVGMLAFPRSSVIDDVHAEIGAQLVKAAGLPLCVEEAVRFHHNGPSDTHRVALSTVSRVLGVCVPRVEREGCVRAAEASAAVDSMDHAVNA